MSNKDSSTDRRTFLLILLATLAMLFLLSACATTQHFEFPATAFDYTLPPQITLEGVNTIAVLSAETDASGRLQALLMEELQELNVNIIDTQQLAGIVVEKELKPNPESLSSFGDLTNVDIFLVAEVIGPGRTAFKVIEKDGRISLARFVPGLADAERVKNILEIFTGYERHYSYGCGYAFPSEDQDGSAIAALHRQGKYSEVERKLIENLSSPDRLSPYGKALYHANLSELYTCERRFGDALKETDEAEQHNAGLGSYGRIQPIWFGQKRELLQKLLAAENAAKAASGALAGHKKGAPNIAVMKFDTKAAPSSPEVGWLSAAYVSTSLAQSNFNVYDRDYFRSLMETDSVLSEKQKGQVLQVDKLIYGKFLKNTPVERVPIYETVTDTEPVYSNTGKYLRTRTVEHKVLDKILVNYELEIQGRIVDVRSGFGKFKTVRKEPVTQTYEGDRRPASDLDVRREWEVKLYGDLVSWIESSL